ncbi:glutamate 5-kinase [Metabacillus fastidiosus]|uniref:Glutamate 5-kinase n=1 Tax=Metabacillus fastidiosus TaxID=1458 RepID=A0ABU6P2R9_9BACI|nr:glutamate 5-kinase [Metabacillus fastidiosus]MED4403655.1 glutamate 5-kinase [Metabacillus fastidiosus]MED4452446.1 glutamate 5-kinase [Metabacillus fastidiosus]MED4463618.1 glutamate 5-kinase [Metabacillus fastidiosus]
MTAQKDKRIVIKIGSSSLTSRHGEISRRKLEKLADEIVLLKDEGFEVVLVSSGAVAAGYRKLGCLTRPESLPEKQAAASIGQGLLMEAYSDLFISHGYVASQILITRSDFSDEARYNNMRNTINVLLERGIIPIVNENDTVTIDRLKFGDNDTLSAKVAGLVEADQLIILSDIDGLYDSNPRNNPNAKLLEKVYDITPEIEAAAGGAGSDVGTGGMKSKIEAVKIAMASGTSTFLGKASTPNIIYSAVEKKAKGTYFIVEAGANNLNQKKQWIAFNSGPKGELFIHEQVRTEIHEKKRSVLLTDILDSKGQFEKGSVIRVICKDGEKVGLGVINYSAEELKKLSSLSANEVNKKEVVIDIEDLVCEIELMVPVGV